MNDSFASRDQNKHESSDSTNSNNEKSAENSVGESSGGRKTGARSRLIPIVTTPARQSSSGTSSSDEENASERKSSRKSKIPSYHNSQGTPTRDSETASHPTSPTSNQHSAAGTAVSADQERQILLLMLLAQVCALHDPTPRTFTVHVLELFERGILGRQSIHFLFELGLVPANTPRLLPPSITGSDDSKEEILHLTTVSSTTGPTSPQALRAQEASAIRTHLEQHDLAQQQQPTAEPTFLNANRPNLVKSPANEGKPIRTSSWAVEHHPLSLSRYQREFVQVRLLNAGSFGEVFQSTSKTDQQDYAVKRVAFSAWGYSKDSVSQVIREVHCLAQCNHPNVVKYYTSWLEPSWMTGSGATTIMTSGASPGEVRRQQKLLTDIQHMMVTGTSDGNPSASNNLNDSFQEFFQESTGLTPRSRKFSVGSSLDSFSGSEESSYDESSSDEGEGYGNWTAHESIAHEDSIFFASSSHPKKEAWESSSSQPRQGMGGPHKGKQKAGAATNVSYKYQICLFIQMQLCHPATLGDWIRQRNSQCADPTQGRKERVKTAIRIFSEILSGLGHIHKKNIVHRDLKPHNLFRSLEDDGVFLIGDFGLSKLIHSATNQKSAKKGKQQSPVFSSPSTSTTDIVCHQPPIELTAGVGTASYAAPEQVTTRTYGKRADIFSLGLILLEMVSCFTTEHERLQTFNDCRHRRAIPEWISEEYPRIAQAILDCTNPNPAMRPTADELLAINLLQTSPASAVPESNSEMQELKLELEDKNNQLQLYEQTLKDKETEIKQLKEELAKCNCNRNPSASIELQVQAFLSTQTAESGDDIHPAEVESSSSSSDEGV